jgi:hypothetical protein
MAGGPLSEPFTMTNEEDARVPRLTRAYLQQQIDTEINHLAGNLAKGIEDYRYRTGKIAGLRMAMEICQEVEKQIGG